MTLEQGGPVLVEGPVEVRLDDGRTVTSDRFMVALCTCRRSRTYPWCDTSHRRRTRPPATPRAPRPEHAHRPERPEGGNAARSEPDRNADQDG
ncbi:CDGSH iron-sulfur domain-containing protein [Streptomyces albus subsp. chlorinus]|uniref:CDGSH iron-sulfur domain-containing protein n=1 Tax=Streptomyces albus TaxID=1888 RepID=UPI0031F71DD0